MTCLAMLQSCCRLVEEGEYLVMLQCYMLVEEGDMLQSCCSLLRKGTCYSHAVVWWRKVTCLAMLQSCCMLVEEGDRINHATVIL